MSRIPRGLVPVAQAPRTVAVLALGGALCILGIAGAKVLPPAVVPPGAAPGGEQVEILLPPSLVFQVYDVGGGPVAARTPFPLAWSGARLSTGNTLRISVRLETPGALLAFQGRGPRGGTCGNGHLTPGAFIRVFDSAAGATAGGCDLTWQLDTLGAGLKHAGRYDVALRWKIESVGVLGGFGAAAAPAAAASSSARALPAGGTAGGGGGSGAPGPYLAPGLASPAAAGRPPGAAMRPPASQRPPLG